jgi:hypothetical protein
MEVSLVEQNINKNNDYSKKGKNVTYTLALQQMAKFYCTLRNYSVITPTHTNTQKMDQI